jgi:hypothetical protein
MEVELNKLSEKNEKTKLLFLVKQIIETLEKNLELRLTIDADMFILLGKQELENQRF